PGLLFLRESEPILAVLDKLHDYDLLMVDGHGLLHPRRFGIACYIGVKIDRPTIGVGKSLLCGTVVRKNNSQTVLLDGKKLGTVLKTNSKPIYVSIGHKVSLRTASKIVKEVTKYRIPEPLRLADINSRKMARA
ncbi:MAG: endonuclease V, partial [Nitrososphaerales archaeon]